MYKSLCPSNNLFWHTCQWLPLSLCFDSFRTVRSFTKMLYVARHSGFFCFSPTTFLTRVPSEQISLKSNFKEPWKQMHTYVLRLQYCGSVQTTQPGRGWGREGGRGLQTFPQNMQSEQGWAPYLLRRVFVVGEVQQLAEHAVGAARLLFAQLAVHGQLLVGHAHVLLLSSHKPVISSTSNTSTLGHAHVLLLSSHKPVISSTSNTSTLGHAHVLLLSSHKPVISSTSNTSTLGHAHVLLLSSHKPVISSTSNTSTLGHAHVLLLSSHQTGH